MAAHGENLVAAWQPSDADRYPVQAAVDPSAAAIAEIVACAEQAIDAIVERAELQITELAAAVEARVMEAGMDRRQRLQQLRHDLAAKASALAVAQAEVGGLLGAIDAQLDAIRVAPAGVERLYATPPPELSDPRVAAIKMTLRERQRIHVPAPVAEPQTAFEQVEFAIDHGGQVAALPAVDYDKRRWWRPWQRAAA